jgi:hypothetical protein
LSAPTARAGEPWGFDVVFVNALIGADPGQLAVAASRTDVVQQARILIGASGVSGVEWRLWTGQWVRARQQRHLVVFPMISARQLRQYGLWI